MFDIPIVLLQCAPDKTVVWETASINQVVKLVIIIPLKFIIRAVILLGRDSKLVSELGI